MEVLVLGEGEIVEHLTAQLAAGGVEVVDVDGVEDAVQRVGVGEVAAVLVDDGSEQVASLNLLAPRTRRRLVVIQVGEKLTTGDGSAAFTRGVNLVVASADIGRLPDLIPRAVRRHRELVGLLEPELRP